MFYSYLHLTSIILALFHFFDKRLKYMRPCFSIFLFYIKSRHYFCNNGCHYYVAMYNKRKKRYDMFPTSHYIDPAKTADLRNKRAILMRIKGAPGLSTVYRVARTKNIHGQPFRDDGFKKEIVGQLNVFQQIRLRRFARTKGKK